MIGQDRLEVERKTISILKVLRESPESVGARVIARRLKGYGVELGERAVRYHLKIMDEGGLTRLVGRDGRVLTPLGEEELQNALVGDKVGFIISKIETLAFRTTFAPFPSTGGGAVSSRTLSVSHHRPCGLQATRLGDAVA